MITLKRKKYLSTSLFVVLFLLFGCSHNNETVYNKDRKAVILILADDMGAHLECMGTPGIQTPALNTLAHKGVMFTNAFSSCASCSPSRASILTGMYPHSNGLWRNVKSPAISSPSSEFTKEQKKTYDKVGVWEHIPTMIEVLNSSNIFTGITNKYHLTPSWKFCFDGRIKLGNSPEDYAKEVEELINMAGDKSLFLLICITSPHRPFQKHLKHLSKELPELINIQVPPFLADTEEMRFDLQEYYGCVEVMDKCTNEIIQILKEKGMYNDALIIFTSDHGMPFHRAKATAYYAGIHIPLIIKGPGMIEGSLNDELISHIDLMPTILEYFNIHIPSTVQGKSLLPVLYGKTDEIEDRHYLFAEHNAHGPSINSFYPSRAIFNSQYYYISNQYPGKTYSLPADLKLKEKWGNHSFSATVNAMGTHPEQYKILVELCENRPPQELYNLVNDPGQIHNLVGNPCYESIRIKMKEELQKWIFETNDTILKIMELN